MLKFGEKKEFAGRIAAAGVVLLLGLTAGIFFDYYYDLNDDVLMKDILAGVYTGSPSGYNIQMLYPVSACISLFYRLVPGIAWYGIFLCGGQLLCLYLVFTRILKGGREKHWPALCAMQLILASGLFLRELVYVQYTVTCALFAGTAAFLFCTTPEMKGTDFLKHNIISIVLMALAFQIRTEMLLLTLPLIAAAGFFRWMRGFIRTWDHKTAWYRQFFAKDYVIGYGGVLAGVCLGLFLSLGVNRLAYGNGQWREFMDFFDSRTQIYDFYGKPDYDSHREFYETAGISREQWRLLENYNFGLDESINDDTLDKIAVYAEQVYHEGHPFGTQLRTALWNYREHLTKIGDAPWNICVVAAYVLLAVFGISGRKKNWLWELPLMAAVRSALWLFILYRERAPERITHSLYLVEFLILCALLWEECREPAGRKLGLAAGIVLTACAAAFLPSTWKKAEAEKEYRQDVNRDNTALREYCKGNRDNYYLVDVMSTTRFSEKMFKDVDNSIKNYDIIGGWASKSPVNREALARFGISDIEEDLLTGTNVYFISDRKNMDGWMEAYYLGRGTDIQVLPVKIIEGTVHEELTVYQVRARK